MGIVSLARRTAIVLGLIVVALEAALFLAGLLGAPLAPRPSLMTAAAGVLVAVLAYTARRRKSA